MKKSRMVVPFEARATWQDTNGVANEVPVVVTTHHASSKESSTRAKEEGRGGGAEVGLQPRTGYHPLPSTLIPLSGLFDQQLTTALCDTYRENAEVRPETLRGRRGNRRFFSRLLC